MQKKVIIADMDETICYSCQKIADSMRDILEELINKGYMIVIISAASIENMQEMISTKVKGEHHLLGTCGTRYTIIDSGKKEEKYNIELTKKEQEEIISALQKLIEKYNIKSLTSKEDQILNRKSQITLSAIGRNAPSELKYAFDPDLKKRREWILYLNNYLDQEKYEIKIGGTTSLDILRKGINKGWGIQQFAKYNNIPYKDFLFFGDRLEPGGNDYEATQVVDCIAVKDPKDTEEKLKELFLKPL